MTFFAKMPNILFFSVIIFILHATAGKTVEITKTTSFNITPYISYNNFISHGEVYADYTKKKVKYTPSITIGLGFNFYEALSKNVSFLHGLDFGYNIYSKKQSNIVNNTKNINENRIIDAIESNSDVDKMQNITEIHDKIEQERRDIIETNKAIVNDLYDKAWGAYLGYLPEERWSESKYIQENSGGFGLIERLNYSKITVKEIEDIIKNLHDEGAEIVVPLIDKEYDNYTSWDEAYNAYIERRDELAWLPEELATEENAIKYAMLKTGLLKKPENYEQDPYIKYKNLEIIIDNDSKTDESEQSGKTNQDNGKQELGKQTKSSNENQFSVIKTTYSFVERYYVMYRIGFNIKQTQNISLQPFLGIGLNIGELHITKLYDTNISSTSKKFKAGFSMGIGMDVIIKERFVIGLNYRLSVNKYNNIAKFYTHCFAFKFGFAFL